MHTLCILACTLNGYRDLSQDRGPAISQFSEQHSSSAVILITLYLEKNMAKPKCLLLKVFYEGVQNWLGGRVIENFTGEAMFSKPMFSIDFVEINLV